MKKILSLLNSRISRVCVACMAMLGFTACSDEECMYGTPVADFEVKGYVKDAAGNPVSDAILKVTYPDRSSGVEVIGKGVSYSNGAYELEGGLIGFNKNELKVVCIPSDPTLEADSTVVKLTQTRKGEDIWDQGDYEATVDFVLKKKEAK
ncbi:MAG: radical SAM-associated putative lipoprotein [Muribaculaceae bacterium]